MATQKNCTFEKIFVLGANIDALHSYNIKQLPTKNKKKFLIRLWRDDNSKAYLVLNKTKNIIEDLKISSKKDTIAYKEIRREIGDIVQFMRYNVDKKLLKKDGIPPIDNLSS